MKEDYVSFETAKLLKEKGFDTAEINAYFPFVYYSDGKMDFYDDDNPSFVCEAPTQAIAMRWLREVHDLHIMIDCIGKVNYDPIIQCFDGKDFEIEGYQVGTTRTINGKRVNVRRGFRTYEEAVEAAIKYCLEHLI